MQELVLQVLLVGNGDLQNSEQPKLKVVDIGDALRNLGGCWRLGISLGKLVQTFSAGAQNPSGFR